jgi:SAM-dependent methyltransferase
MGNGEAAPGERDAAATNHSFYNALWSQTRLARPESFNSWPLIAGLVPVSPARLEVGPGLRPRLPLAGSHFIDISSPVIAQLNARGSIARLGEVCALPYNDGTFDLVCAFDIIEHVEDDLRALAELGRVLKDDALLIFSVPLHAEFWTAFDELVGHVRRYDPAHLMVILAQNGFEVEKSAIFGMQPANPVLLRYGSWFLTHRRKSALFWYNWLFLPLAILCQKRLKFTPGLLDTSGVAEIVLICRHKTVPASSLL